jgi:hypothetical protein
MASIGFSGDTSGLISVTAPLVAGSGVLTLPTGTDTLIGKATTDTLTNKSIAATQLTGTIAAAALPAGSVLQVVSTTKTDTFSTTSSSFVDITGLSATITPRSTSSTILVNFSVNRGASAAALSGFQLLRGATAICIGDAASLRTRATTGAYPGSADTGNAIITSSMIFLDSPATTSATTYKLQVKSDVGGQTICINRTGTDADNTVSVRCASTITVMEIQG